MYSFIPILAVALALPCNVLGQSATTSAAAVPTDIVPFSTLPTCATLCGPLFDAQGACTPPVLSTINDQCFCAYATLQPFYTSTIGVCNNACPNDSSGLLKIQQWFSSFCASTKASTTAVTASGTGTATVGGTATGTAAGGAATSGSSSSVSSGNTTWLSTHYKYVIMIVIIVIAIIGGWIGACLIRRRIHRKRDLNFEMRPPGAPWMEGQKHASPYGQGTFGKNKEAEDILAMPQSARLSKGEKKRWTPKERT
jgi:hypothetical protein